MTRLLFIRHGQTTSNLSHSLDTNLPGAALTGLGWSQARTAGERIAGEHLAGEYGDGLILTSSQALRAQQTASGIVEGAAGAGLVLPDAPTLPGISEIPAGDFEMRSDPEAQYGYHQTFGRWLGGALDDAMPGALTGRAVVGRYLDTLLPQLVTAQRTGADLAVVSHGAVIRLMAGYLGRVDPEWAVRTLLPNTSRVELEVPEFGVVGTGAAGAAQSAPMLPVVPELPTVDAPMVETADYLPSGAVGVEVLSDVVSAGWKVTDWGGHGEPPRVG
ncbi:histidine phosphatase family protein [Corynebacterium terpenotabidum]|uniref:Phosphoglycerate mutase n=1 Tax=Corynebacterium terpenotabidum Y-11 TaxID=1200352 RepID=S4XE11_9CORY|nr:histidine phosphatase family protein [Corynebacterium terpenotabidum]AGP29835.1 hypothetical protein A606_00900 [Corynebacterium terpenotabidum Y-11]